MNNIQKLFGSLTLVLVFEYSWWGRYQPVSLDRASPLSLQAEIKGEVNQPGVYELKTDADIEKLIQVAGGTTEQADLSSIALMKKVKDEDVIVIPKSQTKVQKAKISINSASLEELMTLSGIGEKIAGRIIEYRESQGFQTLEDIMNVKGIGEKMFERIKEEICL
ncbi:ComEA family DNA-binding protein [Ileibacterium valens]|uniref:ComEA family DNA-binding protein n=1 Tax=Ileibacterium valens TaxID=1862668 RepID=UPI0023542CDF|nr:ComEA family DNA-binding protein [Ileibacterium valens]